MKDWLLFEDSCVEYLNRTYGSYVITSSSDENMSNCRIEALRLTGNHINANPYTCMVIKGCYQK